MYKIYKEKNLLDQYLISILKQSDLISLLTVQLGESDSIQAMVQKVQDPIGQSKQLATPYAIEIAKSDVYFNYPLNYLQVRNIVTLVCCLI